MSATTLESRLEALECHFTWDLDPGRSKLLRLGHKLEDIGTEEGNTWLGHIYNLRGFIQHKLGLNEDAQTLFNRAAEAFQQTRGPEEGPWLVVNYGNLAWLHHHLGDQAESEAYLTRVDALMTEYPSPSQDELHPEICAEKAWTLMKFSKDQKLEAADYFQRAIRMQPDRVEWNSSYVILLASGFKYSDAGVEADIFEKVRMATDQDPENLFLAASYLGERAKKGERVEDEACELACKILRNPVSSYSGLKPMLRVYRNYASVDEAVALAEEALRKHPDQRFLKSCAALCYKWKIVHFSDSRPNQSMVARAVSLLKDVISLYPDSSLMKTIDLANIYAKSNRGLAQAEQIYQKVLVSDLEPEDQQKVYNCYAKYLNFSRQDRYGSIRYHMKAAEIPVQSYFRKNSISVLEKIRDRNRSRMCAEISEFLENLEEL